MKINIDFELLRTLVAFADTGSFKLASNLVFRSQPAVSMQMKKLERLVNQQLFQRQGRDVVLTAQGEQMVANARELLAAHDQMVEDLRGQELQGEVRIGMPDDYAPLVLTHVLHRFDEYYPKVTLNILADTSPTLERHLHEGQLDIAVIATLEPHDDDIVLTKEPIVWVTSQHAETHTKRPIVLALFADESPIYRATMASLPSMLSDDSEAPDYRIGVLSKSSTVLLAVASTGFAVATMARCVVPHGFRILGKAEGFPDVGHVYVVVRATANSQSSVADQLTERIVETFADEALGDN